MIEQSRLCSKITLCEYLESCNEEQTYEVVDWIKEEVHCSTLNELLIKIVIDSKELLSNDALINLSNRAKNDKNINNNKTLTKTNKKNKTNKNDHFPLLKLPIDLISTTALFLNKHNLFCFERCNRMCYTMVNNSSFLNKCRNFKKFRLTHQLLNDISSQKVDCYKFSFANEFVFDLNVFSECHWDGPPQEFEYEMIIDDLLEMIRDKFQDMLYYGCKSYKYQSNWLDSLFKCIKRLVFDFDSMLLLDLIPIKLFDKNESQLSEMEINDLWIDEIPLRAFETKYNKYFCVSRGKTDDIITLDKLIIYDKGDNDTMDLFDIWRVSHLMTKGCYIQCLNFQNSRFKTHLKRLSIHFGGLLLDMSDIEDVNNYMCRELNIDTLRLLPQSLGCQTVLMNKILINTLNFPSTLKNLTIEMGARVGLNDISHIPSVLKKEYLYNLENVNILLSPWGIDKENGIDELLDEFFDILCDNVNVLKYQFKQLNLGLHKRVKVVTTNIYIDDHAHTYAYFSWNSTIDVKFVNNQRQQWKSLQCDENNPNGDATISKRMYQSFRQQWM